MAITRIAISGRNDNGHEQINEIQEFDAPADAAKRRRMLMTRIGKIVDASLAEGGPTSMHIIFADLG